MEALLLEDDSAGVDGIVDDSSGGGGRESPVRKSMLRDLREGHHERRPMLLNRTFTPSGHDGSGESSSASLTVMQWNILAMALSQPGVGQFVCEEGSLDWPSRRTLILEEIISREAHLIGCQEVDDFDFFSDALASLGYEGFFVPKPKSPCLRQTVNIGPDGCAIFFSKHRFAKLDSGSRVLRLQGGSESNSVAAWVVLKDLSSKAEMTFVTTHLKSGKEERFAKIREQQTKDLAEVIKKLVERTPTLICCGDFNGTPGENFFQLLTNESNKLTMESAYSKVLGGVEPEYTTWKIRKGSNSDEESKRCIDYLFYTSGGSSGTGHLSPVAVLNLPDESDLKGHRFPRLNFPSDHLDLIAKFTLS